jgi:hypothetical protein
VLLILIYRAKAYINAKKAKIKNEKNDFINFFILPTF